MKKSLLMLLIIIMVVSLLAACSGSGNTNNIGNQGSTPTPTPATGATEAPGDEHPTYWMENPTDLKVLFYDHPSYPYTDDWPILDWIEEETNIRFKGVEYAGDFSSALALIVASGETPDVVRFGNSGEAMQYGQMGAMVDLNDYLDQLPNLQNYWEMFPDKKAMATSPEGAIFYAIDRGINNISVQSWIYREDLHEKHNLIVPTNWDELYEVSKFLKEEYPDAYPLTTRLGMSAIQNLAASFATFYTYYPDPNTGEVQYGPVTDRYKDMVTWLHKFYSEGLFVIDWLSMDTPGWVTAFTTEKAFFGVDFVLRVPSLNLDLPEGASFAHMPPVLGHPDGGVRNFNRSAVGFGIFKDSDNLEASLKYIDFMFSEEGKNLASWGREGITYQEVNGEKEFIKEAFIDGIINNERMRQQYGLSGNALYGWYDEKASLASYLEEERVLFTESEKYHYDVEPITPPNFSEDENEILSTIGTSIDRHRDEAIAKFILGDRPLSEWDNYVNELNNLGLQRMVDLHREAWEKLN